MMTSKHFTPLFGWFILALLVALFAFLWPRPAHASMERLQHDAVVLPEGMTVLPAIYVPPAAQPHVQALPVLTPDQERQLDQSLQQQRDDDRLALEFMAGLGLLVILVVVVLLGMPLFPRRNPGMAGSGTSSGRFRRSERAKCAMPVRGLHYDESQAKREQSCAGGDHDDDLLYPEKRRRH
jgi:hypothetical protein